MKTSPSGSVSLVRMFVPAALTALAFVPARAQLAYRQLNLVSDVPGLAAHTDPHLVNPWGISAGPTTPFWVSDADAGVTTLYNTAGQPLPLVVGIPKPGGGSAAPTGQVFNADTGAFNSDRFLFATEDGTIAGWRGALGPSAETLFAQPGASYKGLAIASSGGTTYLYVANFAQGTIDVFATSGATRLLGTFTDPTLPAGYAPFNVQTIGDTLYVTYAKVSDDPGEEQAGAGLGFVDKYDANGNLLARVASSGTLNAPWGLALAPDSFGAFAGDLLVGNFGDGLIHAFDPSTGAFVGVLRDADGNPIQIDGLWGLRFGNGAAGGDANTLYFAAGIDDEAHGLFGSLTPIPEPATYGFAAIGLIACCIVRQRRRAHAIA